MGADEFPIAERHAAEVLRPRSVGGGVEDHAADLAGTQLLRLGRKSQKSIDSALGELLQKVAAAGCRDPVDVVAGVETDVRRNGRKKHMSAGARLLGDADPFASQVADGTDGLVREQLVAAGMHPGQGDDRLAGIHVCNYPRGRLQLKIELAACHGVGGCVWNVANIGKPFRA
jgi:hypothetical protein